MNELEDKHVGLVKAINDGEGLLATKEAELVRLRDEERALEDKDVASSHDLDSTAYVSPPVIYHLPSELACSLRLQICRSLGFEPVIDKEGNLLKILVRE